jgi:hypothetical protein
MTQKDIIRMAREAGFVGFDGENGSLRRFAALVAAAEREACVAKVQAEIDHAVINETRLVPFPGRTTGEIAVRVGHLEAALDAIRARGKK